MARVVKSAGTGNNELLSEPTAGGTAYSYTYGRPNGNGNCSGNSEIEAVHTGTATGYILHDPAGVTVAIETNSSVISMYVYDGIGNPVMVSTSSSTTSYDLTYDP